MKEFIKKNTVTLLIVLATIILAGVAIFTAIRLYELRQQSVALNAPENNPQAAACTQTIADSNFTPTQHALLKAGETFTFPVYSPDPTKTAIGYELTSDDNTAQFDVLLTEGTSKGTTSVFPTAKCAPSSVSGANWYDLCGTKTLWSYKVADADAATPTKITSLTVKVRLTTTHDTAKTAYLYSLKWIYKTDCAAPAPSTAPAACQALLFTLGATPTPTPTPTPSITPSPTPVPQCGTTCSVNTDCPSSMMCYVGVCRNASCTGESSCVCATATPTSTPTASPTNAPTASPTATPIGSTPTPFGATPTPFGATPTPTSIAVVTTTDTPTAAPAIPVTGSITPTILGIAGAAILILVSLALVL